MTEIEQLSENKTSSEREQTREEERETAFEAKMKRNAETIAKCKEELLQISRYYETQLNENNQLDILKLPLSKSKKSTISYQQRQAIWLLIDCYAAMSPFPTSQILEGFKSKFGFKDHELKWFISFDELSNEIVKVNRSRKYFIKATALPLFYQLYFRTKITYTVLAHYVPGFSKRPLKNIFQNIDYQQEHGIFLKQSNAYQLFVECTRLLEPLSETIFDLPAQQFLKKQAANTIGTHYLGHIYTNYFEDGDKSPCVHQEIDLYDLFRMLLQDPSWFSREEFEATVAEGGYMGYGNKLNRFQQRKVNSRLREFKKLRTLVPEDIDDSDTKFEQIFDIIKKLGFSPEEFLLANFPRPL